MPYGKVTSVIPGKNARYQVKLDNGVMVTVNHDVINPKPAHYLRTGSRLVVQSKDGEVISASTDLSRKKPENKPRPGDTTSPPKNPPASSSHSKSSSDVKPGRQMVTIVDYNSRIGEITVQTESHKKIRIRLPLENRAWLQVFIGRKFPLEITLAQNGSLTYSLAIPIDHLKEKPFEHEPRPKPSSEDIKTPSKPEAPKQPDATGPGASVSSHPTPIPNEETFPGQAQRISEEPPDKDEMPAQEQQIPPADEEVEVHRVGVDRAYFNERKQEGHRYEIMAFIESHLDDELIEWYRMYPKHEARFKDSDRPLAQPVARALKQADSRFERFYSHQVEALDAIRSGKNLVIITQTASGKTLCYNPAIFEHFIASNPSACALYVFPLNALLMDQKEKIDDLAKHLTTEGIYVNTEILKGGVTIEKRHSIAHQPPHILALNPELLSVILGEYEHWQEFFQNLKYVVIDEVHSYRGALGMHMAGLVRRLLLATRRHHNQPQFILSSATVNNPMELVTHLTPLPPDSFQLLSEKDDGSYQANKHWLVLNPDLHQDSSGYENYLYTAAFAMIELLTGRNAQGRPSPLNTILFAKSIREVKKVFRIVQDNLRLHHPDLVPKVRHYVSADLGASEKREIYNGLKTGQIIGVVSTNALEAGIDIGRLDACIVAGFPFWVMRMKQMAGRVGRQQEGVVLFVPHPVRSLDQYYRAEPELLLHQPPEAFVVDPENPYIARKHINAAAYSMQGLTEEELKIFGERARKTVKQAITDHAMRQSGSAYYGTRRNFNNLDDPYAINRMRSSQQIPYAVCQASQEVMCRPEAGCFDPDKKPLCGLRVSVLDQPYAYRDCHVGAIYEGMDGFFYRVVSFDDQKRSIRVNRLPEGILERTSVEENTEIEILEERDSRVLPGGATLHVGDVKVTRSFTGYNTFDLEPVRKCRRCRLEVDLDVTLCPRCKRRTSKLFKQSKLKQHDFSAPYDIRGFHIHLTTIACWLTIPAEMESALSVASPCKLPGPENRLIKLLKNPVNLDGVMKSYNLDSVKSGKVQKYFREAHEAIQNAIDKSGKKGMVVFPGVYNQCLLHTLREVLPESQALDAFERLSGYPVTKDLNHICRKCMSSTLLPAMHAIEHAVLMRYPSVALGDPTDLGSHTTLGHLDTQRPTIFWYDNYQGGMGAADKLYDQMERLFENSIRTITSCNCTTIEGCPNCTQLGYCNRNNQALSKPAALVLLSALLGQVYPLPLTPFIYPKTTQEEFTRKYENNEHANRAHGVGEEAPPGEAEEIFDPHYLLRVQKLVHERVVSKAYSVRSEEIATETPVISAAELSRAFQVILNNHLQTKWNITPGQTAYQRLQVHPSASLRMIQQVYRVIAMEIHPDRNRQEQARANEMMLLLNEAYAEIVDSKSRSSSGNNWGNE